MTAAWRTRESHGNKRPRRRGPTRGIRFRFAKTVETLPIGAGKFLAVRHAAADLVRTANTFGWFRFFLTAVPLTAVAPLITTHHRHRHILVPKPSGLRELDGINVRYPTLWQDGPGFATLVLSVANQQGFEQFRVYLVDGSD